MKHQPISLALVCECYECSDIVDVTPHTGETDGAAAPEYQCADCGKIVCEDCYDTYVMFTGGRLCGDCADKRGLGV